MRRRFRGHAAVLLVACLACLARPATASRGATGHRAATAGGLRHHVLANGLRLVMHVDRSQPWVAIATSVPAGGSHEPKGQAGAAALVAELLQHRPGQNGMVTASGGQRSASVQVDRATFVDELPKDRLPLGLWLAGERLRTPPTDNSALERARSAVSARQQQAQQARELEPVVLERLRGLALLGQWSHGHLRLADLPRMGSKALSAFHASRYIPNAAVVAIVGDFEAAQVQALAERYLGHGAARPLAKAPVEAVAAQTSTRSLTLRAATAQRGAVAVGWFVPAGDRRRRAAAELCSELLSGGPQSPLADDLVRRRSVALTVRGGLRRLGPHGLAWLLVQLPRGARPSEVRAAIAARAYALGARPTAPALLEAAKRRLRRERFQAVAGRRAMAVRLAELQLSDEAGAGLAAWFDEHAAISGDEVQQVARDLFVAHRSAVVELLPARWRTRGGGSNADGDKHVTRVHGKKSSKRRPGSKARPAAKRSASKRRGRKAAPSKSTKRKSTKRKSTKRRRARDKGGP